MRAEFQVLVIPFVIGPDDELEVAVFKRKEDGYWQFIAGGGEDDETILEAAKREASEEAGIAKSSRYFKLDSMATIPKSHFHDHKSKAHLYVIPEYCFGVLVENKALLRSTEHAEHVWVSYDEAMNRLSYDCNKTALWELRERIKDGTIAVH